MTYGINYRSPLNSIEQFHVANSQVPQDFMHVVLEGVLPLETKLLLYTFIYDKKYFTLNVFNERVTNFTYGKVEARNKPPKEFKDKYLKPNGNLKLSCKFPTL